MKTITVFELVHYLKGQLDYDENIQNILVAGEISNFNNHYSGHLYFSIKDDKARISCIMFKSYASKLLFKPKNGDKVILKANTSLYEASGQLQLYITEMKVDGIGELYLKYEILKDKLSKEGLFNDEHKKTKPQYPTKIAVLVGDKSAAMSDIKTCFKRRWPIAQVDYYPVLVQGNTSSSDIINRLLIVDELGYDAIILARGGGSIEDLWSFNDEILARTIYNLKTFIITGIGHEQDFTIADFVADLRAPTPTASVELITPDIIKLHKSITDYQNRIKYLYISNIRNQYITLDNLNYRLVKAISYIISQRRNQYEINKSSLLHYKSTIIEIESNIKSYEERMIYSLFKDINDKIYLINTYNKRIKDCMKHILLDKKNYIHRLEILLKAFNIENTLKRGYSITFKDNEIIKNIDDINIGDKLEIRLVNGKLNTEVKEIKHG